jgi:hypothetical protein
MGQRIPPTEPSQENYETLTRFSTPGDISYILWFSVLFTLEIGIRNGELNQVFYLLDGLRRANPSFLLGDWYTWSTSHHHVIWSWLVAFFASTGILELGLTVGAVVTDVLVAISLYSIFRALYVKPLLPWGLSLLLFAALFTRGIGDHQLLPTSLEPFGIASAGLVAGFSFLTWERPFAAGVCWGLAGLVHAQFAMLIMGILVLSTLTGGRRAGMSYWARLWAPFVLFSAPSLIQVALTASAPMGREAFDILARVAPQHYLPWQSGWKPFALFAGTLTLGIGGILLHPPRPNYGVSVPVVAVFVIVLASLLLGTVDAFWFVNRADPWRLSSILMLAGLACGCAALANLEFEWLRSRQGIAGASAMGAGIVLFLVAGTQRLRLAVPIALFAGLASAVTKYSPASGRTIRRIVATIPAILLTLGMLPVAYKETTRSHVEIRTTDPARAPLYDWARSKAPSGSVFIIPPDWKDFRLNAQRAIIVDWWVPPMRPSEIIEWYDRLIHLTGVNQPRIFAEVESAYATLDCTHAEKLRQRYRATHLVMPAKRRLYCGPEVYRDNHFVVLQLDK